MRLFIGFIDIFWMSMGMFTLVVFVVLIRTLRLSVALKWVLGASGMLVVAFCIAPLAFGGIHSVVVSQDRLWFIESGMIRQMRFEDISHLEVSQACEIGCDASYLISGNGRTVQIFSATTRAQFRQNSPPLLAQVLVERTGLTGPVRKDDLATLEWKR